MQFVMCKTDKLKMNVFVMCKTDKLKVNLVCNVQNR